MIYTPMTNKAMDLCFKAHKELRDKGDIPYVFHPFHVAEQMNTEDEVCAALLHDVVEDTKYTFADLEKEGFSPAVMEALRLLTHDDDTPYLQYVERLCGNRIAARVKLADLRHNSMPGRLQVIGDKERKRMRKYLQAQAILTGGEYDLEEMTLRLRYEIPEIASDERAGRRADHPDQPAVLTAVLAPDGHVRKYTLVLPSEGRERDYRELYLLLQDLEEHGYSASHAVACLS